MPLATTAALVALAPAGGVVFWANLYGFARAGAALVDVLMVGDRLFWGALWLTGFALGV